MRGRRRGNAANQNPIAVVEDGEEVEGEAEGLRVMGRVVDNRPFKGPIMVKYIYNSRPRYCIVESGSFLGNSQVKVQLVTVSYQIIG